MPHPITNTPVTIITGFLGAGKTTLLNYILQQKGGRNIAVIENEFGEVNIDRALVSANLVEKEDLVSLQNGCVCCSLRKDIVKAFAEIERRSRQGSRKVDAIVLETTGLADPAPVAFTFFANPWIASRFRLDCIICVVDARYLMQHLEDAEHPDGTVNEAVQQIAFADMILLNKTDLVDHEQLLRVRAAIRIINNNAKITECQLNEEGGRPDINDLLDINLFSVKRALEVDPSFLDSDSEAEPSSSDSDSEGGLPQRSRPRDAHQLLEHLVERERLQEQAEALAHAGHVEQPQSQQAEDGQQHQRAGSPSTAPTDAPVARDSTVEPSASPVGADGSDQQQQAGTSGTTAAQAQAVVEATASGAAPSDAAEARSAPAAGPSSAACSSHQPMSPSKSALALARKYHIGSKRQREEGSDCEDNCEECSIKDGMPIKGDRRPKRKAKRLHDLSDVSSVGIIARGELDEYRFNMFMRDLLSEKAKDIFRCKGVLSIRGYGNRKFVFQGVHETICYGPVDLPSLENKPSVSQVVFIGRGLDRKALTEGFRTCVWSPLPEGWQEFRDEATKQPYYVNLATGEKSWDRPSLSCARIVATQGATQQPLRLLPRRSGSMLPPLGTVSS